MYEPLFFLLLVLHGEVWVKGPYIEAVCMERVQELRGPEDAVRPVQSMCIDINHVLIREPLHCVLDDEECETGELDV